MGSGFAPLPGGGGGDPGDPRDTILILETLKGIFQCILIDPGKEFWSLQYVTLLMVHS